MVYGPITNDGGDLEIEGDIMGPIKNVNGGTTKFCDEADIYGPIEYNRLILTILRISPRGRKNELQTYLQFADGRGQQVGV